MKDAITAIGVPMALNQALAASMDVAGQLADQRLRGLAKQYQDQVERVAIQAQRLANLLGDRGERHFTAALLSRIGELVTLVGQWARVFGNRIKVQWRLALEVRELVGSIYQLPEGTVARDRLIMRAAGLLADGGGGSEECLRLLRRLGLADEQGMQNNDSS